MGEGEDKLSHDLLCQRWIHSHEEDTATEMVFRPATFPFPRSRGRISFDLRRDGTLIGRGIGPTDRRTQETGRWRLTEDTEWRTNAVVESWGFGEEITHFLGAIRGEHPLAVTAEDGVRAMEVICLACYDEK